MRRPAPIVALVAVALLAGCARHPSRPDDPAAASTLPDEPGSTAPAPTAAVGTAIGAAGAFLQPVTGARRGDPAGACADLASQEADRAWAVQGCGRASTRTGTLVWVLETGAPTDDGAGRPTRASVWRQVGPTSFEPVLRGDDTQGAVVATVTVRVADVSGDGDQDVVLGVRSQGSAALLSVEVVEGPGRVTAHVELGHGEAVASAGRIDTYAGVSGDGEPVCCPSRVEHDVLASQGGAWKVVGAQLLPAAAMPKGDFA